MLTRFLGLVDYAATLQAMQQFTQNRTAETEDELWICEHPPVFTLGLTSQPEHHLQLDGRIPVIQTNRGGQVTYHGPGQVVAYPLIDLRRTRHLVKQYVFRLEQAIIDALAQLGVEGLRVDGAPGIYVRHQPNPTGQPPLQEPEFAGLAKIAALGIKISRQCTYHGLALNVQMDLEPYQRINPCGHAGLQTTDLTTIGTTVDWQTAAQTLAQQLCIQLAPTP